MIFKLQVNYKIHMYNLLHSLNSFKKSYFYIFHRHTEKGGQLMLATIFGDYKVK